MKSTTKKEYIWYKDAYLLRLIGIFLAIVMIIFSFVRIPIITTMHAYTIEMLFGNFSIFFYLFIIFYFLKKLFFEKFWINISWRKITLIYFFIGISVMYFYLSISMFLDDSPIEIGPSTWNIFKQWFNDFTYENNLYSPLIPQSTKGGLVNYFLVATFSMAFSSLGSFIFSCIILVSATFILGICSYKLLKKYIDKNKSRYEKYETNNISEDNLNEYIDNNQFQKIQTNTKEVESIKDTNLTNIFKTAKTQVHSNTKNESSKKVIKDKPQKSSTALKIDKLLDNKTIPIVINDDGWLSSGDNNKKETKVSNKNSFVPFEDPFKQN